MHCWNVLYCVARGSTALSAQLAAFKQSTREQSVSAPTAMSSVPLELDNVRRCARRWRDRACPPPRARAQVSVCACVRACVRAVSDGPIPPEAWVVAQVIGFVTSWGTRYSDGTVAAFALVAEHALSALQCTAQSEHELRQPQAHRTFFVLLREPTSALCRIGSLRLITAAPRRD